MSDLQAALDQIKERMKLGGYRTVSLSGDPDADGLLDVLRRDSQADVPRLVAAVEEAYPIIRDIVDPDDCRFDHHGGCQAHGYISLEPGETCPHHDAKRWMETLTDKLTGDNDA